MEQYVNAKDPGRKNITAMDVQSCPRYNMDPTYNLPGVTYLESPGPFKNGFPPPVFWLTTPFLNRHGDSNQFLRRLPIYLFIDLFLKNGPPKRQDGSSLETNRGRAIEKRATEHTSGI